MKIQDIITENQQGVTEGVNAKQIKRDLDAGMSHDAVIGKHANKRMTNTDEIRRVIQQHAWEKRTKTNAKQEQGVAEGICPECGGPSFSDMILAEKQDACYHKVRSRYKVWPSAYASGALVQCRKKGAANWGTGGKKK